MWIELLRVADLRCLAQAELTLGPGLNWLLGPNGAGKTSLLEAAYLISRGHSFRPGSRDALIRRGTESLQVFARVRRNGSPASQRLGLERRAGTWTGRVDEQPLERLTDLFRQCAVCCFEPGSHELIAGSSEGRRAFLDWGVFHVEQDFLGHWRRYQAALKQRNSLLKQDGPDDQLDAWDQELDRWGQAITVQRAAYLARFGTEFAELATRLLPGLAGARIRFLPGWDVDAGVDLAAQLRVQRLRDRQRHTTTLGPHRADWRAMFDGLDGAGQLSRGQAKLTALAAVLAQARGYRQHAGEWPVLLVDDLPSELDLAHQTLLLEELQSSGIQAVISATERGPALDRMSGSAHVFHVEHGQVSQAPGT